MAAFVFKYSSILLISRIQAAYIDIYNDDLLLTKGDCGEWVELIIITIILIGCPFTGLGSVIRRGMWSDTLFTACHKVRVQRFE